MPVSFHALVQPFACFFKEWRIASRCFFVSLLGTASESGQSKCLGLEGMVWCAGAKTDAHASLEVNFRLVDSQACVQGIFSRNRTILHDHGAHFLD